MANRQVVSESKLGGDPLDDRDAELLRRPIWDVFQEVDRDAARRLNNRVVDLVRASITRAKADGAPTIGARRGLNLPEDWYHHYNVVYHANLEWAIAAIMQNALLPINWLAKGNRGSRSRAAYLRWPRRPSPSLNSRQTACRQGARVEGRGPSHAPGARAVSRYASSRRGCSSKEPVDWQRTTNGVTFPPNGCIK